MKIQPRILSFSSNQFFDSPWVVCAPIGLLASQTGQFNNYYASSYSHGMSTQQSIDCEWIVTSYIRLLNIKRQ